MGDLEKRLAFGAKQREREGEGDREKQRKKRKRGCFPLAQTRPVREIEGEGRS